MYKNFIVTAFLGSVFLLITNGLATQVLASNQELDWVDDSGLQVQTYLSEEPWVPAKGDRFEVDVDANYGQLVHQDGTSYSFPVLTGQKRNIYYIGRYYYAATPKKDWQAKSLDIKADRMTFGASGRFLRLYNNGESTPYGIHPFKYYQYNLDEGIQNVSYGCILVNEELMDLIQKTWELNGEVLEVKTV